MMAQVDRPKVEGLYEQMMRDSRALSAVEITDKR